MPPLLPAPEAFAQQAGTLIGKKLTLGKSPPLSIGDARCLAAYINTAGVPCFVAITDVAFVASVGAALALMPASVVTEALRTGKPAGALVENAYEVLNVAAALFNDLAGNKIHVKLDRLRVGPIDAAKAALFAKSAGRVDMSIEIAGYPAGKLALIAIATATSAQPAAPAKPPLVPHVTSAWMVWPPRTSG